MNQYPYECPECQHQKDIEMTMKEYDENKKNNVKPICEKCGSEMSRIFTQIQIPLYNCGGFYCKP